MFTCSIENEKGDIYDLTNNENEYQVLSVDGTNPPSAQINLSKVAMLDGSKYNSAQLNIRNVVLKIKINGDVESNRIKLYSYFRSKEWIRIHYSNESRKVYIDGYVETIEVSPFDKDEIMQVSIICPNPYFNDETRNTDTLKKVFEAFEFPFAIDETGIEFSTINVNASLILNNSSERETGFTININVIEDCNKIKIRKLTTSESITIEYNFMANDQVIINTNKGQKSIKLIRNGVTSNIFSSLKNDTRFFQFTLGDNVFDYEVNNGSHNERAEISFGYNFIYGGV